MDIRILNVGIKTIFTFSKHAVPLFDKGTTTVSIKAPYITIFRIMALSIINSIATVSINDTKHNDSQYK